MELDLELDDLYASGRFNYQDRLKNQKLAAWTQGFSKVISTSEYISIVYGHILPPPPHFQLFEGPPKRWHQNVFPVDVLLDLVWQRKYILKPWKTEICFRNN